MNQIKAVLKRGRFQVSQGTFCIICHSLFSLNQVICISRNYPGCRNTHWDMEVQTQWGCAQGTQILGLTGVLPSSLPPSRPMCWHWQHTDHRFEKCYLLLHGILVILQMWPPAPLWGAQGEATPVLRLVYHLEAAAVSDNSADTWNAWRQRSTQVAWFVHCLVISWEPNARKMLDFSEAGKLFWCFAVLL